MGASGINQSDDSVSITKPATVTITADEYEELLKYKRKARNRVSSLMKSRTLNEFEDKGEDMALVLVLGFLVTCVFALLLGIWTEVARPSVSIILVYLIIALGFAIYYQYAKAQFKQSQRHDETVKKRD